MQKYNNKNTHSRGTSLWEQQMLKKIHKQRRRSHIYVGACIIALILGVGYIHHDYTNAPKSKIAKVLHHQHHQFKYVNYHDNLKISSSGANSISPKNIKAKSALVVDDKNGNILYSKNINQPRKVASVAKLMTLYLAQRKANELNDWNKKISIPNNLCKMSNDTKNGLGGFKLKKNQKYTISQLYQAALIQSSNASAIALGEWTAGGSNTKFIKMMNAQAKVWHLKAHFISASGLENDDINRYGLKVSGGKSDGNEISAKSIAIIARHLLHEAPSITGWSSKSNTTIKGQEIYNVNTLLKGGQYYKSNLHIDGLKSGFTPSAGFCFVGTGKPNNKHRIITVVLHDEIDMKDTQSLMKAASKE